MNNCIKISASAGSGKTFRLTLEFLKIVLQAPENFNKVMAVTFTNKAALEMKDRFINALYDISQHGTHSKYFNQIGHDIHVAHASKALHSILHRYDEFYISTMDHFFLKLLRVFSSEIFINSNFDIEVEKLLLDNYILDRLFTDLLERDNQVKVIIDYLLEIYLQDELNPLRLKKVYLPDYLNLYLAEEFYELEENFQQTNLNKLLDVLDSLKNKYDHSQMLKEFREAIEALEVFFMDEEQFEKKVGRSDSLYKEFVDKVFPAVEVGGWYDLDEIFKKENKAEQVYSMSFVKDKKQRDIIQKSLIQLYEKFFTRKWSAELIHGVLKVMLIAYLNRLREDFKRENGTLFIFEFNHLIAHLLKKYSVPFIYEYIGTKLEHLFIDEFQDTSYLQYKNFFPLVEELLSRGGRVIVVGDIKQSIYRWRNGNFAIMRDFPNLQKNKLFSKILNESDFNEKPEWVHDINYSPVIETLKKNFRSAETIVKFNNYLYKSISTLYNEMIDNQQDISLPLVFQDVEQEPKEGIDSKGWIHLIFYESESSTKDSNDDHNRNNEEEKIWLNLTEQEILRLRSEYGCLLGDIAVLLRTNQEVYALSQYLTSVGQLKGIRVESPGLIKLSMSPHVRLAMASWGFITQPDNTLIKAEILVNFNKLFRDHDAYESYLNSLRQIESSPSLVPVDLLEEILNIPIHSTSIALMGGDFLTYLREEIYRLQLKGIHNIKAIWRWWQEKGREVLIPSTPSREAVQIMTIHASKGLEFPFVILPRFPFTNKNSGVESWYLWKENDVVFPSHSNFIKPQLMHDEFPTWMKNLSLLYEKEKQMRDIDWLTLSYVATTRAKYGMSIFIEQKKKYSTLILSNEKKQKSSQVEKHDVETCLILSLNEILEHPPYDLSIKMLGKNEYFIGDTQLNIRFDKTNFDAFENSPEESPYRCEFNQSLSLFMKKSEKTSDFNAVRFGKLIHRLLQQVYTKSDVERIITAFLTEGIIREEDAQRLRTKLIDNEILFPTSADAVILNERSLTKAGKIYRPDRMIVEQNKVLIMDYKTGDKSDEDKKQMEIYSQLLEHFFPNVTCELIYLKELFL
ncbi:MAG: UvrD-helicase domain-containing protein [Bacteroidales bacterium]|nr:UvrD-helicase domain-containing protein [Bacteroidales bacterium]